MEGEPAPRNRRFIPKAAPRRVPKPEVKILPYSGDPVTAISAYDNDQLKQMALRQQKAQGDLEAHAICKVLCFVWLPPGHMSRMLVYRNGAIKLKLGDSLFDVSSGMKCGFAQDVVVTNENEKGFGIISELNKRAIATPDIDSVLESIDGLL